MRLSRLLPLVVVGLASFAPDAMAQQLRYSTNAPGRIIATGNTLGLAKDTNANGPGVRDSIGTFLTLGNGSDNMPLNLFNPWPAGTTNNWTMNGSTATLDLPVESEVLYAELLWGGSFQYGAEDVSGQLNTPVTIRLGGQSMQVAPSAATALTVSSVAASGFDVRYYMRSADVTAFVAGAGGGVYSVSGVPATQTTNIESLNAAGWTLVVAVRDQSQPTRNLTVFVGGSFVDEDTQQDYTVNGFCAPPAGTVEGTAIVSTIEGDANLTGDQFLISRTQAGPFVNLQGPNNPAQNFFCGQINDSTGNLDTTGSFGNANHIPSLFGAGINVSGARQGWDITTVPLSSSQNQLFNSQTSAVLRTITTGDSYMPILVAFAIDVNSPDFGAASTIQAMPASAGVGDTFAVTTTLSNAGEINADVVRLALPVPDGLSLVSVTSDGINGDITGGAVTEASLAAGINEGVIGPGQTRAVVLTFTVDGPPAIGSSFLYDAAWSYDFAICGMGGVQHETFNQFVAVPFEAPMTSSASSAASSSVATTAAQASSVVASSSPTGLFTTGTGNTPAGATTSGGNGGEGGEGGSGPIVEAEGCSCRTVADPNTDPWKAITLLGIAGVLVSRRARRGRRAA